MPCIKVRETHRHAVRHHALLESKQNEEEYGQKRTLIESLFGNTKQKLTSHIKTKDMQLAQTYALLRLALFNMYYLVKLEKQVGGWVFEWSRRVSKQNNSQHSLFQESSKRISSILQF